MRSDIQALRGFAILSVLLFHARMPFIPGGYLGVDVFFVISGFLITNLIVKQIALGNFSFKNFYFRRVKRLLPAAYTTFIVSAIGAIFLLTSQEMADFSNQLLGAVTFTANMVLWRQGSYFGVESDLKPLLHIWSLSIEEQYYFILPAALYWVPRKYWFRLVFGSLLLSIAACVVFYEIQAGAAFYLFPSRAWELCIGSIGVFLYQKDTVVRVSRLLFVPAVAGLLYVVLSPIGGMHPGIDSLLACVCTLIVIFAELQKPLANFAGKILCWFGDISYSLYLVHWPIFALVNNVWMDDAHVPLLVRLICIVVSVVLGYLQFKFIEYPIHKAEIGISKRNISICVASSSALLALALVAPLVDGKTNTDFISARRGNVGFAQACAFKGDFLPLKECQSGAEPDVMVWGDSNAMHLVPGLDAVKGSHSIIQATKYVCGPLLGVSPVGIFTGSQQNKRWSLTCQSFNDSVYEYLAHNQSIKVVVLSSYFSQYLSVDRFSLLKRDGSIVDGDIHQHYEVAEGGLATTIEKIRALGKKVVVVAPPPAMDFDMGRCVERNVRRMAAFGEYSGCEPPRSDIEKKRAPIYKLLDEVAVNNNVAILKFNDTLDNNGKMQASIEGRNIFIANAHLSYSGSEYLARKMNLLDMALEKAK